MIHTERYGIPHPIHTVLHAENIVRQAIPGLSLEEVGIEASLVEVLNEDGIHHVGQLDSIYDEALYNLPSPIIREDLEDIKAGLAKVGMTIVEKNDFTFEHPDNF